MQSITTSSDNVSQEAFLPGAPRKQQSVYQSPLVSDDPTQTSTVTVPLHERNIDKIDEPQNQVSAPHLSVQMDTNIQESVQATESTIVLTEENSKSVDDSLFKNSLLKKAELDFNEFEQDKYLIATYDGLTDVLLKPCPVLAFTSDPRTASIASRIEAVNRVTNWCYGNINPDKDTHITVISMGSGRLLMEETLHNLMIAMNIPEQSIYFRCIDPKYSSFFNSDEQDFMINEIARTYFRSRIEMDESGQHYKESMNNHTTIHSTANDYFNQLAGSQSLPVNDRQKGPVLLLSFAPAGPVDPNYLEENGPDNVVTVTPYKKWPVDSSTIDSIRILSVERSVLKDLVANMQVNSIAQSNACCSLAVERSELKDLLADMNVNSIALGNVCCSLTAEGEPLVEISSVFRNEGYSEHVDQIICETFHILRRQQPEAEGMELLYSACLGYTQIEKEKRKKESNDYVLTAIPCADYNTGLNKLKAFFQTSHQKQSYGKCALFELKFNSCTITDL